MPKKYDHLHKYHRVKNGRSKKARWIYKCEVTGCTHFLYPELMRGRSAQCFKCGNQMTIGKEQVRQGFMRCENCIERKDKAVVENIDNLLDEMGI